MSDRPIYKNVEGEGDIEELYRKSVKVWGLRPQLLKTIEEAAELQRAIARYLTKYVGGTSDDVWERGELITDLMDEVVDVEIMIGQVKIHFERYNSLYELCRFEAVENFRRLLALEEVKI